jgi:hypothetical protein
VVSGYTVQDHLKSVFDKTEVRSRRRELVAAILRQHYLPGAKQGRPVGPDGFSPDRHDLHAAQRTS